MIQSIGHIAAHVSDLDRALDFYCRVLGGKKVFEGTENGEVNMCYVKFCDGQYIELFKPEPGAEKHATGIGFMHLCLTVPDIYEAEKQVKAAGWPAKPVRKGKYGNYQLWIADPDGLPIELMQILPDFLLGNA